MSPPRPLPGQPLVDPERPDPTRRIVEPNPIPCDHHVAWWSCERPWLHLGRHRDGVVSWPRVPRLWRALLWCRGGGLAELLYPHRHEDER